MSGYFLYPITAILTIIIVFAAVAVGNGLISFSERLRKKHKRAFVVGRYNSYYKSDYDILLDKRAKEMLPVIGRGYKQDLDDYMTRISEDRLPPCVVLNWVRSISEDLSHAALPVVNIKKWHENMLLLSSDDNVAVKADSIDLTNYEECFIWGCIVRWLDLFEHDILDDDLKSEIFRVACPKRYLKPYYNITSMSQEEKLKIAEAIIKSGNVNIAQLSIGDNNTMNYNEAATKGGNATRTEEEVKRAVVRLMDEKDEQGRYIVFEQGQFFAIKAVLTSPLYGFPVKPSDFKNALHNLEIDNLRVPYDYESVRKIHPQNLPSNVELWGQYQNTADEYSMKQVRPAVRLMQILAEEKG